MADTPALHISRRTLVLAALAVPLPAFAAKGQMVTVLGDSITAGLGLPGRAALPAQLHAALLKLGVDSVVRGAGVSGDTTAGGAARVDFSVPPGTAVCVVALGGNDLLQGTEPRRVRANLERILQRLRQRRIGVVLAGLKAPQQIGRGYARDFNAVFPALAAQYGAAFYPDLLAGVARNPRLNQADGLHPNAQGVQVIARGLAPLVARALRARP